MAQDEKLKEIEVAHVRANQIPAAIEVRKVRDAMKNDPRFVQWQAQLAEGKLSSAHRSPVTQTWKYLTELEHSKVKVGYGAPGFGSSMGYEGREIVVEGEKVQHGISLHPPGKGKAFVEYELPFAGSEFEARVGINNSGVRGIATAVRFHLVGDGEVLWSSEPIGRGSKPTEVRVSLPGVKVLRLEIECPGPNGVAHTVWIDPKVR